MTNSETLEVKPWYQQPWAWFILSPLIVVVIWSSILLTVAFKKADDVVKDNYYKEGRMINQRLEEDKAAKTLGIKGTLTFDLEVGEIVLNISAVDMSVLPKHLALSLDHPVEADYDISISLIEISPGYYTGELERKISNRWYFRLAPLPGEEGKDSSPKSAVSPEESKNNWRLIGEINLASGNELLFGEHE